MDHEKQAGLLDKFGIDPGELLGKLKGGGLPGFLGGGKASRRTAYRRTLSACPTVAAASGRRVVSPWDALGRRARSRLGRVDIALRAHPSLCPGKGRTRRCSSSASRRRPSSRP